ncbi:hypothetical protein VL04_20560 [Chromobacterium violaceum]|uniref:DUF3304 domain-containing protein n=1 Tax=Chromobacterium violaceum TaxID=536 RepID=UPI000653FBE5|nr:DUF3304 domain-containing protein [Chromobacterium violaceum]KMN51804.1 hypothetical protein VK93_00210 [Chromobacterium violaceum]KMN84283.1 hypothetical protein VL02_20520 [Chromobacterium violaceum]KMN88462.1 hypothetical protein VL04_20560 [Chromobacterium violaceum]KMO02507.1 hypothetical protein VL16_18275 [Chromobacterium violaceum]
MSDFIKRIWLLLLSGLTLSACAGVGGQLGASMTVVNYSGKGYDWVAVAKPDTPEQAEAADMVKPYGASGIMCCVNLPAKWQPGMKLVVQIKDETKAKTAAEWSKENIPLQLRTVEVPRYTEGDVGTVWVQFLPDGKIALVVSRYDPSNANWPGVINGWPKPSMEYRRKIWSEDLKREKDLLKVMQQAIQAPKVDERDKPAMQETINDIKMKIDQLERALK